MRVLFWSEQFWPEIGGAQLFAARLLPALRKRGHEFLVVARRNELSLPESASFDGIPVFRIPFYAPLLDGNMDNVFEMQRQVLELKRTFEPALLHINNFGASVFFCLGAVNADPAPLLFTLHGERYRLPVEGNTLLGQTLRRADRVSVPSGSTAEYVRNLVPGFAPSVSVIYHGLEMPSLPPQPLPLSVPRLLCLGRLAAEKGFDLALQAFALIADRFPQAHLVLAGDGPERDTLEAQATALGLGRAVEFAGWLAPDDVPAVINASTFVVMPSRREALGLVALEAAVMARPVVGTRVGGLPEVVVHGQTGLLVGPGDSVALAGAMTFLLEHPEEATQMGQAARSRAMELFSSERQVAAYDALYRELAAEWEQRD
jgi:glycogen(starch) synthase